MLPYVLVQFKITMRGPAYGIILYQEEVFAFSGFHDPNWWLFLLLEAAKLWSVELKILFTPFLRCSCELRYCPR